MDGKIMRGSAKPGGRHYVLSLCKCICVMSCVMGLSVFLVSCGNVRPLYAPVKQGDAGLASFFRQISLASPKERFIQEIQFALRRNWDMGASSAPLYRLHMAVKRRSFDSFLEKNTDVTRRSYSFEADFTLEDMKDASVIFSGTAFTTISHDVTEAEFSNINAREDAFSRGAYQLSEDIRLRLAGWYAGRK